MLDTLRPVETPEGLALDLRCAGVVPRALAWAIDTALRFAVAGMVMMLFGLLGDTGAGIALVLLFLLYWAYPVVFEGLWDGQPPAKRALGLRVANHNGTPVTWLPSIVRNLMRVVDMMPALYGFGVASTLIDPSARRIGDVVAGTVVVYVDPPPEPHAAPPVEASAPRMPLLPEEQRAIVAFAERSWRMTGERQDELATLLAPVTGAPAGKTVPAVLAIASYLLGRR
jgi:uncharacterized RDD family membrane protein YckC